jgi:hypothetical protein
MLSFYCLLATIILIVSYTIFTYNSPPYDLFIKVFAHNCTNDFIKFLSIINLSIFISGNLIVLFYNNTSYEQLKKKVYIPCVILQIIYLNVATFIINYATCSNHIQLTNYYYFVNGLFWLSIYGLYCKLLVNYIFN